jgi:hypothetical protein
MALTQISTGGIKDDAVTDAKLPANSVGNSEMKDDAVGVDELSATGTASSTTFLRGDNSWVTPTDTNTQLAFANDGDNRVVTGDGSGGLNGEANLTFDGTSLLTLQVPSATGEPAINFTNSDTGTGTGNGFGLGLNDAESPYIWNRENTDLRIATNNAERVRIAAGGAHLFLGGTASVNEITEGASHCGLVLGNTSMGNGGISIVNSTTGAGRIYFGDNTGSDAGRNRGQLSYYHDGDFMLFATAGTESMRIESGGDVSITDGNLKVASGHGIDFSANSHAGGMTSELLDSYEEGTWTPNPMFGSTDAGETAESGGGLQGQYTKIGNFVYLCFSVNFNSRSGSASSTFYIAGLPYAITNNNWNEDGGHVHYYTGISSPNSHPTITTSTANSGSIYFSQSNSAYDTAPDNWGDSWSQIEIGTGTIRIRGSVTYRTS